MGKHSDYKKKTTKECAWCDYSTPRCRRKSCKYYRDYVKKWGKKRSKH